MDPYDWTQFARTAEFKVWYAYCTAFSIHSRHKNRFKLLTSGVIAARNDNTNMIDMLLSCGKHKVCLSLGHLLNSHASAKAYYFEYSDPDSFDKIDGLIDQYIGVIV